MLWFDVEKRYNTTNYDYKKGYPKLWFDVEKRYNTTARQAGATRTRCGLM